MVDFAPGTPALLRSYMRTYWPAEDQPPERVHVEGWEIAAIERDGKRFILRVADPVRGSLTFIKKRER